VTQMKPQFDTVTLDGDEVHVEGPIDLSGDEEVVAIWVQITQGAAVAQTAKILEPGEAKASAEAAAARFSSSLDDAKTAAAARGSTGSLSPDTLRATVADGTPRWEATAPCLRGTFDRGVKVRAWASVTVQDPPDSEDGSPGMWLTVTWNEEVVLT